jgi:hypothetical protein
LREEKTSGKVMPAPKKNKNAVKKADDLLELIPLYISHISSGYSKRSFIECDYRTIESHIENDVDLCTIKKDIEKAERIGRAEWERIGKELTNGKLKGNPATWIFTMKNKYSDEWNDSSQVDHNVNIPSLPSITIKTVKKTD